MRERVLNVWRYVVEFEGKDVVGVEVGGCFVVELPVCEEEGTREGFLEGGGGAAAGEEVRVDFQAEFEGEGEEVGSGSN